MAMFIFIAFIGMFGYNSYTLYKQQKQLDRDMAILEEKLYQEQVREKNLAEFETYTHTKKYAEKVAKEKLGYVYEGEIIFQKDK
ncbi:MAG: septum formation initiator family protein [Lachnospiraceae bacterium]|nr:septum formation initiator family protein [Lachnospiraceae bacterium]